MVQINDEGLEALLQGSLKNTEIPPEELNLNLKRSLRYKTNIKVISLWSLPLIAAILFSICISTFSILFISSVLIKALVLCSFSFSLVSISILTYMGVKNFELKEGAKLEI